MTNGEMLSKASEFLNTIEHSEKVTAGKVACVLLTEKGNMYAGVSIDAACGVGFCAETNAVGAMITGGESRIKKICAVKGKNIVSPCGKCRELMIQTNSDNKDTEIILDENKTTTLKELLPEHWLS